MRAWLTRRFERNLYGVLCRRKARAGYAELGKGGRGGKRPGGGENLARRFETAVRGLDTPWRVASFVESCLIEEGTYRLFDIPYPPELVWDRGVGNAADYARLAQAAFARNGRTALLLTVYDGRTGAPKIACAAKDDSAWFHISNEGLFGPYEDLAEIADDFLPGWRYLVARSDEGKIVDAIDRGTR